MRRLEQWSSIVASPTLLGAGLSTKVRLAASNKRITNAALFTSAS